MGQRRQLPHVGDALGQVDQGGAAPQQFPETLGSGKTGAVVVEGQEDPGAAPQVLSYLFKALGTQGGAGGVAPGRQRQPGEDPFGQDEEGISGVRESQAPAPAWGRGTAWKRGLALASTARPVSHRTRPEGMSGTVIIPANRSAPRSRNRPLSLSRRLSNPAHSRYFRSPRPRRVAQAQPQGCFHSDAPRSQVLLGNETAPQLTGVEAYRRRQQRRVPGRERGSGGPLG